LSRTGAWAACEQLATASQAAGHPPNSFTFHFRIMAYVAAGKYEHARRVYLEATDAAVQAHDGEQTEAYPHAAISITMLDAALRVRASAVPPVLLPGFVSAAEEG
jgi:hypothetical protein